MEEEGGGREGVWLRVGRLIRRAEEVLIFTDGRWSACTYKDPRI